MCTHDEINMHAHRNEFNTSQQGHREVTPARRPHSPACPSHTACPQGQRRGVGRGDRPPPRPQSNQTKPQIRPRVCTPGLRVAPCLNAPQRKRAGRQKHVPQKNGPRARTQAPEACERNTERPRPACSPSYRVPSRQWRSPNCVASSSNRSSLRGVLPGAIGLLSDASLRPQMAQAGPPASAMAKKSLSHPLGEMRHVRCCAGGIAPDWGLIPMVLLVWAATSRRLSRFPQRRGDGVGGITCNSGTFQWDRQVTNPARAWESVLKRTMSCMHTPPHKQCPLARKQQVLFFLPQRGVREVRIK